MTQQQIYDALDQLRQEIEELKIENPETRDRLAGLVESIEQRMIPGIAEEGQPDVLEEMKDAVTHFEVEHPRITGILNELMVALSSMGI